MGYSKQDGRPQDGRRSKVLQVRIDPETLDALKRASSDTGVSVSEFVRRASDDHVQRAGRGERLDKAAASTAA